MACHKLLLTPTQSRDYILITEWLFVRDRTRTSTGITLFTLIHDPINGKPDIIVLHQARDNAYAQISAYAECFLEHLRLCL